MQKIVFVSRAAAMALPGDDQWGVISIHDSKQGPAVLSAGWHAVLRLEFEDVDVSVDGQQGVFDEELAAQVLAFAQQVVATEGKSLLVHCHAGISRSAAIAVFLGALFRLPVSNGSVVVGANYSLYNKRVYRMLQRQVLGYD